MIIKPVRLIWSILLAGTFIFISFQFGIGWGQIFMGLILIGMLFYEISFRKPIPSRGSVSNLCVFAFISIVYGLAKTVLPDLQKITSSVLWQSGFLLFMFFGLRKLLKQTDAISQ